MSLLALEVVSPLGRRLLCPRLARAVRRGRHDVLMRVRNRVRLAVRLPRRPPAERRRRRRVAVGEDLVVLVVVVAVGRGHVQRRGLIFVVVMLGFS
jgi:hypothetical protein